MLPVLDLIAGTHVSTEGALLPAALAPVSLPCSMHYLGLIASKS